MSEPSAEKTSPRCSIGTSTSEAACVLAYCGERAYCSEAGACLADLPLPPAPERHSHDWRPYDDCPELRQCVTKGCGIERPAPPFTPTPEEGL